MTGRPRNNERRREQQDRFLAAFAETGVITQAAEEAGIVAPQHHKWLGDDADYAARFAELKQQTADIAKTNRRKSGIPKGYVHPLGSKKGDRKRASQDRLLAALAESGIVADASKETGIPHEAHVVWMRTDPAYAERAREILDATAELRKQTVAARVGAASRKQWENPERRQNWGEYQKGLWTPEKRAEAGRRASERMADPEYKATWLAANRSPLETPEGRERHAATMKELWADPEYRERQLQGMRSPERRQKSSDGAKAQWARMSPEERREIMRKRRVVFKGGFRLTQIEATVISALNDLEAWYRVHAKVDGYIADILVQPDLVVECDGAWFHNQRPDTDEIRDQRLAGLGFRTLRLGEAEIKDGSFTVKLRESLGLAAAG